MTDTVSPVLSHIVGPTAAGKSAIAMHLAEVYGLAIVSADSRQVYRGFDIGTAKPTAKEQARVPHYGIDIVAPTDRYSAHAWATAVPTWTADAAQQGRDVIIVGGTGLYVRALVQPLDPVPELDAARRAQLEPWLARLDRETLVRWCERLDPARAHLGRTQLLRALETALLTGHRLGDALGGSSAARPARYLVVDPGAVLRERVAHRVQSMLDAGWIDEIARLRETVPAEAPAWKASGYAVLRDAVEGRCTMDAAVERVIIETRQYAKRQRTWFRHQLPADQVTLLDPTAPDAREQALAWWAAARHMPRST